MVTCSKCHKEMDVKQSPMYTRPRVCFLCKVARQKEYYKKYKRPLKRIAKINAMVYN